MVSAFGIEHGICKSLPSYVMHSSIASLKPAGVAAAKKTAHLQGRKASAQLARAKTKKSGWTNNQLQYAQSRNKGDTAARLARSRMAS
jgi:hypothetical protein